MNYNTVPLDKRRKMVRREHLATIDGVGIELAIMELVDSGEVAYGCRLWKGDPEKGPYLSTKTDIYYEPRDAKQDAMLIARNQFGIDYQVCAEALGI